MDNNFNINFSFLKTGFWITILLGILKITNVIDIPKIWVFVPLFIGIAGAIFIIFVIGLITLYLMYVKDINPLDNNKKDNDEEEDP